MERTGAGIKWSGIGRDRCWYEKKCGLEGISAGMKRSVGWKGLVLV